MATNATSGESFPNASPLAKGDPSLSYDWLTSAKAELERITARLEIQGLKIRRVLYNILNLMFQFETARRGSKYSMLSKSVRELKWQAKAMHEILMESFVTGDNLTAIHSVFLEGLTILHKSTSSGYLKDWENFVTIRDSFRRITQGKFDMPSRVEVIPGFKSENWINLVSVTQVHEIPRSVILEICNNVFFEREPIEKGFLFKVNGSIFTRCDTERIRRVVLGLEGIIELSERDFHDFIILVVQNSELFMNSSDRTLGDLLHSKPTIRVNVDSFERSLAFTPRVKFTENVLDESFWHKSNQAIWDNTVNEAAERDAYTRLFSCYPQEGPDGFEHLRK